MAFTPFVETDAPTMAAFNEKFAQAIAEAEGGALGKGVKIETGSYSGTGKNGASNPNSLTFGFTPKLWGICGVKQYNTTNQNYDLSVLANVLAWGGTVTGNTNMMNGPTSFGNVKVSYSGNTVTYYSTNNATMQLNQSGNTYYYFAIG